MADSRTRLKMGVWDERAYDGLEDDLQRQERRIIDDIDEALDYISDRLDLRNTPQGIGRVGVALKNARLVIKDGIGVGGAGLDFDEMVDEVERLLGWAIKDAKQEMRHSRELKGTVRAIQSALKNLDRLVEIEEDYYR